MRKPSATSDKCSILCSASPNVSQPFTSTYSYLYSAL